MDGNKPRVLVVDDEPNVRLIYKMLLRSWTDVTAIDDGSDAIRELASGANYDAILCDLTTPGHNGLDVLRWTLAHRPGLANHLVFVTGGTSRELERKLGSAPVFYKPLDRQGLFGAVETALAGRGHALAFVGHRVQAEAPVHAS